MPAGAGDVCVSPGAFGEPRIIPGVDELPKTAHRDVETVEAVRAEGHRVLGILVASGCAVAHGVIGLGAPVPSMHAQAHRERPSGEGDALTAVCGFDAPIQSRRRAYQAAGA
jgi:hypothetical protein